MPAAVRLVAAAVLAAAALTGCTGTTGPAPSPTTRGTASATAQTLPDGQVVLSRGDVAGQPWVLSTRRDPSGRLCMTLGSGTAGSDGAVTCGLPQAAGAGFRVAGVPGPGGHTFYYAVVPETAGSVQLKLSGSKDVNVTTTAMPAQSHEDGRFFVVALKGASRGAAQMTPLDHAGQPISFDR